MAAFGSLDRMDVESKVVSPFPPAERGAEYHRPSTAAAAAMRSSSWDRQQGRRGSSARHGSGRVDEQQSLNDIQQQLAEVGRRSAMGIRGLQDQLMGDLGAVMENVSIHQDSRFSQGQQAELNSTVEFERRHGHPLRSMARERRVLHELPLERSGGCDDYDDGDEEEKASPKKKQRLAEGAAAAVKCAAAATAATSSTSGAPPVRVWMADEQEGDGRSAAAAAGRGGGTSSKKRSSLFRAQRPRSSQSGLPRGGRGLQLQRAAVETLQGARPPPAAKKSTAPRQSANGLSADEKLAAAKTCKAAGVSGSQERIAAVKTQVSQFGGRITADYLNILTRQLDKRDTNDSSSVMPSNVLGRRRRETVGEELVVERFVKEAASSHSALNRSQLEGAHKLAGQASDVARGGAAGATSDSTIRRLANRYETLAHTTRRAQRQCTVDARLMSAGSARNAASEAAVEDAVTDLPDADGRPTGVRMESSLRGNVDKTVIKAATVGRSWKVMTFVVPYDAKGDAIKGRNPVSGLIQSYSVFSLQFVNGFSRQILNFKLKSDQYVEDYFEEKEYRIVYFRTSPDPTALRTPLILTKKGGEEQTVFEALNNVIDETYDIIREKMFGWERGTAVPPNLTGAMSCDGEVPGLKELERRRKLEAELLASPARAAALARGEAVFHDRRVRWRKHSASGSGAWQPCDVGPTFLVQHQLMQKCKYCILMPLPPLSIDKSEPPLSCCAVVPHNILTDVLPPPPPACHRPTLLA